MGYWRIFYLFMFFLNFLHHPKAPAAVPLVESASLPVQSSHTFFKRSVHCSLPPQATGKGVDGGALAGDMPPLLCTCGDAHLCRQPGGKVQLEQERVWNGAGQLLLGLLLHPSVRGLRQRQVGNKRATVTSRSARQSFKGEVCAPTGLEGRRSSCFRPQPGAPWRPSPPSWPTSAPSRSSQWPFPASSWACCKVNECARVRGGREIRRSAGFSTG